MERRYNSAQHGETPHYDGCNAEKKENDDNKAVIYIKGKTRMAG